MLATRARRDIKEISPTHIRGRTHLARQWSRKRGRRWGMSMFKRKDHSVPVLNTASLPDLIFTVLFFFMIVTHMKENQMKVKYQVPQGTRLERLAKKSTVSHIYIGKPYKGGGDNAVQVNDKIVDMAEIEDFIAAERKRMSPDDARNMTVSIKADKKVDMGVVTDVKQALRRANALKILYSGKKSTKKINKMANQKIDKLDKQILTMIA